MLDRSVKDPLNASNMPANQGMQPYAFVPSYVMAVGAGAYQTGYTWYPTILPVTKCLYASHDVPFQTLSVDYKP